MEAPLTSGSCTASLTPEFWIWEWGDRMASMEDSPPPLVLSWPVKICKQPAYVMGMSCPSPHTSHPLHSLPTPLTQESGALQPEAPTTTAPLIPFSPPCLVSLPAGVQASAIPAGSSSALVSSCCQPNIKKQAAWSHSFSLNSWYTFGISKSDLPTPRQNRKQTYFIGWNTQEGALFVWILMLRS